MTGCKPKGGQNDRRLQPDLGLIAVADLSDESPSEIESPPLDGSMHRQQSLYLKHDD